MSPIYQHRARFSPKSRIFGWIWILASLAAVGSLVAALVFEARWSYFFVSLASSIVAKWLMQGFHDNKLRVAYETKLVEEGYSPEEAGRMWTEEYLKR